MANKKLPPIAGINVVQEDARLEANDGSYIYVREAVNIDITESGKAKLRPGLEQSTQIQFKYLWQSSLHNDCFGLLNGYWVKVDPITWQYQELIYIGEGEISHQIVNNLVYVAGNEGIFFFNGERASPLVIQTPSSPMLSQDSDGSLSGSEYGLAISWLVGSVESALSSVSSITTTNNNAIHVQFPMCLDDRVTSVNLYVTDPGGSELKFYAQYHISDLTAVISDVRDLGAVALYKDLSPMLTGKYLRHWRGRLLISRLNVLYFSEAMTYHLIDERYNFIQFPQRITFVEPVDGGIWVGQVDHVVFLRGNDFRNMQIENKFSKPPIPSSSVQVDSDVFPELSQGGMACVIWLAENGFNIGTPTGQLIEKQSDALKNITAKFGTSVVLDKRIFTVVS